GLEPGFDDGYTQPFSVVVWLPGTSELVVGSTTLTESSQYAPFTWSGSGTATAEIVFVGHGLTVPSFDAAEYPDCPFPETGYDDYAGVDVTGKIALILRHAPNEAGLTAQNLACPASPTECLGDGCLLTFGYKMKNARAHGAAAAIIIQDFMEADPAYPQGTIDPTYYEAGVPVVAANRDVLSGAIADLATWADAINTTMQPSSHATGVAATVAVTPKVLMDTPTANAIGVVPGTDATLKDEVVVIGAHFDHLGTAAEMCSGALCPGADDNASGTATMLELARAMTESGVEPKRTIVFAGFSAEEEGLFGSISYVADPISPIGNVTAMFAVDMVGMGDGTGLDLYDPHSGTAQGTEWISQVMSGAASEQGLPFTVQQMSAMAQGASDNDPFAAAGRPAVIAVSRGFADHTTYHTPQDTIDCISLDALHASVDLMWAVLVPLALGTEGDYQGSGAKAAVSLPADHAMHRPAGPRQEARQ
ncbi:MAG: M20/M25/M40 family metallo-hydrolase, partial [Deltaproteobacteria bacterium]|nr:M20/M25/M40 family metallo-hydrolase [Deltaproteobacteria bacterium]